MKFCLVLALAVFCGVKFAAADVITNVTCQVGANPAISNASNCSVNATNSQPSARAGVAVNQVSVVSGGGLSTPFAVNVTGLAAAVPLSNIGSGPNISSNSTANATVTYDLSTLGPVRPGVLTYLGSYSNWQVGSGDDSAQISVSLGSLSASCSGIQPFCSGALSSLVPRSVPFTLGNSFAFQFAESFAAYGDPLVEGPGSAGGTAAFTFQLFEADGTTPVVLYAAPEPGTLGLLLLPFFGFGIAALRRNGARSTQS